jgi:hypothetical protein
MSIIHELIPSCNLFKFSSFNIQAIIIVRAQIKLIQVELGKGTPLF